MGAVNENWSRERESGKPAGVGEPLVRDGPMPSQALVARCLALTLQDLRRRSNLRGHFFKARLAAHKQQI